MCSWNNESFSSVRKKIYLVFKSSISAVKAGKKPFPFCYRVRLVMALTATKLPLLTQITYDFFFFPRSLIKSTTEFVIKQFMKSSKFYQGKEMIYVSLKL